MYIILFENSKIIHNIYVKWVKRFLKTADNDIHSNKIKMQWKWLMNKCIENKSLKFSNKNDKISNGSAKDLQNEMLWFSDKRSWYID